LVGLVGIATIVAIYRAHPNVNSVHFDANDPFLFPCVVSNDESLVTFYNVIITFQELRPDMTVGPLAKVWGIRITYTRKPIAKLVPGDRVPFSLLPMSIIAGVPPRQPEHVSLKIAIQYGLHLLPFVPWERKRFFGFTMIRDSSGVPFWIPEERDG
jgi:hypothetical protein